jgi:DNA helicase-2/ATP-dependent DNA helicase PcrA
VIWVVDGWFPSSRSLDDEDQLEEERRLMYVAMTRARNHLAVTYPLNVYATRRGSDYSIDQLSRFIDRGVRDKMQRVVQQEPQPPGAPEVVTAPQHEPAIDLRALLRGRFAPS